MVQRPFRRTSRHWHRGQARIKPLPNLPWQRLRGKTYITVRQVGFVHAGFEFEMTGVPEWLRWPVSPHDPEWLWVVLKHDADLELLKLTAWQAAIRLRRQAKRRLTRRRWLIPPAFALVLIWTKARPPRRVFC